MKLKLLIGHGLKFFHGLNDDFAFFQLLDAVIQRCKVGFAVEGIHGDFKRDALFTGQLFGEDGDGGGHGEAEIVAHFIKFTFEIGVHADVYGCLLGHGIISFV